MSLSFNYASDLHIDMGHTLPEFPGGKLLILAGDTCEARLLQKNIPDPNGILDRDIMVSNRDRINGFMRKLSEIYEHVIIVAGNHDHYHMEFGKTIARMREHLPDNFHVLDQDCFELEDVLFVGATLWTDMNKYDPMTIHATKDMLNDFTVIKWHENGIYRKFKPEDSIRRHEKDLAYIKAVVENPANQGKKIVLVNHHAPTSLSVSDYFKSHFLLNGAFHSRLDDFILDHPQINLIIHGHTHTKFDYMVGDTRVVCNPRGYVNAKRAENTGWNPGETITL